jgi:hypothetical protein
MVMHRFWARRGGARKESIGDLFTSLSGTGASTPSRSRTRRSVLAVPEPGARAPPASASGTELLVCHCGPGRGFFFFRLETRAPVPYYSGNRYAEGSNSLGLHAVREGERASPQCRSAGRTACAHLSGAFDLYVLSAVELSTAQSAIYAATVSSAVCARRVHRRRFREQSAVMCPWILCHVPEADR